MSQFQKVCPGLLEHVCSVSREACVLLTPLVRDFYYALNHETSKLKADKSVFTIADGIVQHLLVHDLFKDKFDAIIGEEEDSLVNITNRPYTVEDLTVPEQFYDIIDNVKKEIILLSNTLDHYNYKNYSVFIDPIDGTREFATNLGEQCSICIGFSHTSGANATNFPVAGIVYRPITEPPTWAIGAKSEQIANNNLQSDININNMKANGFLTSNGGISKFIENLMIEMKYERVPSGGAGNKMLMLLENKGNCYIQDRGVSRWDTCAAQAVLEAHGGTLYKLTDFINNNKQLNSYAYKKSNINLDFENGVASLTAYNAKDKNNVKKNETNIINDVNLVKPYSNLCGIIALDKNCSSNENINKIYEAIQIIIQKSLPAYD